MLMLRPGTWQLRSELDPRWNKNGEGMVGLLTMPFEAAEAIEEMKKELGDQPEDLEWSYMKD